MILGEVGVSRSQHLPVRSYTEALTGFSVLCHPDSLLATSLSRGCILGAASRSRAGKWDTHFKDKRRGEEPPGAWVNGGGVTLHPLPPHLP